MTGIDGKNRSTIASDAPISAYKDYPELQGLRIADIWKATVLPTPLAVPLEANTHTVGPNVDSDLRGFNVRYLVFPPHSAYDLHTSATLDFAIVMSGEIVAVLEDGEVTLRPNDIFIQRSTCHGWKNPGDKPCAMLFFIAGAK